MALRVNGKVVTPTGVTGRLRGVGGRPESPAVPNTPSPRRALDRPPAS